MEWWGAQTQKRLFKPEKLPNGIVPALTTTRVMERYLLALLYGFFDLKLSSLPKSYPQLLT